MIELEMCKAYIHAKEVEISSRRIKRFSYHAGRCKKTEDRVKLIAMILVELAYTVINLDGVIESSEKIKNKIFQI